jgi:hypothetical protein
MTGRRARDLSGRQFGWLLALRALPERDRGHVVWLCGCRCGTAVRVASDALVQGYRKSCGCAGRVR